MTTRLVAALVLAAVVSISPLGVQVAAQVSVTSTAARLRGEMPLSTASIVEDCGF